MNGARPQRDRLILLLALAGAGVDAVVILGFNVLTAAQTGNTILLAVAIAEGRLAVGISAAVSVVGYVIGAAASELMISASATSRLGRAGLTVALVAEGLLLGGLIVLWRVVGPHPPPGTIAALVALAAVAMGIQSAVVLRFHAGTTTTYITGMLTTFTTGMVRSLLAGIATADGVPAPQNPAPSGDRPAETVWQSGLTWLVYAAGAVVCGVLFLRVHEAALLVPVATVLAVAFLDSITTRGNEIVR